MTRLDPVFVQSWYNLYQLAMMAVVVAVVWWPRRGRTTPFHWSWSIPLISVFLTLYTTQRKLPSARLLHVSA